jgi:hypothetical protein
MTAALFFGQLGGSAVLSMQYAFDCYLLRFGNPGGASPSDALFSGRFLFSVEKGMLDAQSSQPGCPGFRKNK